MDKTSIFSITLEIARLISCLRISWSTSEGWLVCRYSTMRLRTRLTPSEVHADDSGVEEFEVDGFSGSSDSNVFLTPFAIKGGLAGTAAFDSGGAEVILGIGGGIGETE